MTGKIVIKSSALPFKSELQYKVERHDNKQHWFALKYGHIDATIVASAQLHEYLDIPGIYLIHFGQGHCGCIVDNLDEAGLSHRADADKVSEKVTIKLF